ncbi:HEAT repeat domain-containing protein [bacterium]|nr:HEAT repeat domain-containing protein [bacterium]
MLYIGKKLELMEFFKSIPLEQKAQLYRGIRSIMAMLVKVSKMTEIYSVHDKIFSEFTETMKQNFDVIHNLLPFATISTKKVGFYYQERKIKLFDEGERKFRNIFLTNEIRELYFVKGITPKEIVDFFAVIQETLNYTLLDYDFNTRLWDYGITHIGTISDPDLGDPEPWQESWFKSDIDPVTPDELFSMQPQNAKELSAISNEYNMLPVVDMEKFNKWAEASGKDAVVKKYLERAVSVVLSNPERESNRNIVGKICEYAIKNIQNGDFISGYIYINDLILLEKNIKDVKSLIYQKIKEVLDRIKSEDFLNTVFEVAVGIDSSQIKSFSSLLNLISEEQFETAFTKLCELDNKEVRLSCLEGLAKNLKDKDVVQRFIDNPDWHVVRNFLYIMRFAYNPEFLPQVREVMNHQVKQIRIEAAHVLSIYDADENLEYWERAVFCPDEEVRILAVENLVKVKDMKIKSIFNEIFKPVNRSKFNLTDYERYMDRILASGRNEFFDLPGSMIFSENRELRITALKSLNKISNPSMVLMQVKRRISSPEFLSLDKEEIDLILGLMKGEMITPMLEYLEYLFTLHGNIFNKNKYLPLKKQVFGFVMQRAAKNMAMRNWIEKGKKTGDSETRSILEGRS